MVSSDASLSKPLLGLFLLSGGLDEEDQAMAVDAQAAYDELIRRSRELGILASCSALLGWDEQTYMPVGGAGHRGEQMAQLAGLHHERATDPRIGELLEAVTGTPIVADADSPIAVNVRELRRSYQRRTRLPRDLVEALARTTSLAQQEWITARRDSDFRPISALARADRHAQAAGSGVPGGACCHGRGGSRGPRCESLALRRPARRI